MATTTPPRPIPEDPLAPLLKPYGPYVLVRKLAEGGMAEIFLAKLLGADGFERNVVIKRMLPHLSNIPDFVEMFREEARLAAKLAHPNIIQIQELGFTEGCYYICMEYLAGEDFSQTLRLAGRRRHYVPLSVVLRVLVDAAQGLHFAHEFTNEAGKPQNIVHRDISPSNLYLTYQGQVKVLDFGIAKAESRLVNTRTGVVKGKYMYMAPEQARGKEVDRRADVFALGVTLYEALTHVRPFSRDNDLAVLDALLQSDFKPPRELRPDLPEELEAIVLKAMAFKPEDRFATAEAFADALEGFLGEHLSASGNTQLGAFLRGHFGEERFTERSRIPTLATLTATYTSEHGTPPPVSQGAAAAEAQAARPPSPSNEVVTAQGAAWVPPVNAEAKAQSPGVPTSPGAEAKTPVGAPRWRMLAVGLACGALIAGAAVTMTRGFGGGPTPTPGAGQGAPAAGAVTGAQGPVAPSGAAQGAQAVVGGTASGAAQGSQAVAGGVASGTEQGSQAVPGGASAGTAQDAQAVAGGTASGAAQGSQAVAGGVAPGSAQGTQVAGGVAPPAPGATGSALAMGVTAQTPGAAAASQGVSPETPAARVASASDEELAGEGRKPASAESSHASGRKLVSLSVDDIQRRVMKGYARISSCFERNKGDLPANQGEVQVELTIVSSGKVQASTRGPLGSTRVGHCLESEAQRLRFPPHRDQQVTAVVPFAWRLTP